MKRRVIKVFVILTFSGIQDIWLATPITLVTRHISSSIISTFLQLMAA